MSGDRLRRLLGAATGILVGVAGLRAIPGDAAPKGGDRALYSQAELAAIYRHSPLGALPPDPTDRVADNPAAARLGQFLFFDGQFSANGKVSCATCHQPDRGFADGRKLAQGIAVGTRNAPTVLNAAFNRWFFWDGRVDSLWSQATQPLENPREGGGDRLHIVHLVAADRALRLAYERIFGPLPLLANGARFPAHARPARNPRSPLAKAWRAMAAADRSAVNRVYSNLCKAIEAYERKLISRKSPFDRYVEGLRTGNRDKQLAISPEAKRGLKVFVGAGNCDLCHSGPAFSDGQFHDLGLPVLPGETPDPGRAAGIALLRADTFNGVGLFSDDRTGPSRQKLEFLPPPASQLGAFKTPSLRNVARTAPYMHDGRFATLARVMKFYAKGKAASVGRLVGTREATANLVPHLTAAQQGQLIAFLKTLSGAPLPKSLTEPPRSP